MLTERALCEKYARVHNLEEPPDELLSLLHAQAQWRNKWFVKNRIDIEFDINRGIAASRKQGLRTVELVSGYDRGNGEYIHCTVSVPIHEPDRCEFQTMFSTDGCKITRISSLGAWLAPHWPYPDRLFSELKALVNQGVPIAPLSEPEATRKPWWPEDGRNYPGVNVSPRQIECLRNWNTVAEILGEKPKLPTFSGQANIGD